MNGWSMSIPTLNSNYTIYVTSAIVASQGTRDQIDPSEWSEPVTLSGPNNAIIYLYQRAANTGNLTEIPEIVTYSFSEKKIISDTGNWSQTPPEMTEDHLPCYIIQATVLSSDITDTVNKGEWSNPVILAKDGIDGTKITKIVNYYQVNNSEKAPSIDSGIWISDDDPDNTLPQVSKDKQYLWNFEITYDEEEPLNTTTPILLSKWSEDGKSIKDILEYFNYNEIKTKAPDYEQYSSSGGVGPGWVEREKFSPPDPKNDKIYYVWNIEVILYNDNENSYNQLSPHISSIITKGKDGAPGSPGSPGSNGYSAETVMLYKRSSVENPDPPLSTITYYLKDYSSSIPAGTFSGNLNGWSTTIAAANNAGDTNNPLYMIAARASTQYYSDTIYSSEWTDPVVFTENGQNGYTYAAVKIYKCSSTPLEDGDQPNKETEFYYIFSTGSLFERTSNGLKGWYTTLHEALANGNNEPCYISETQLVTDSANNNEVITFSKQWSTPVLYTKNGIDGSTYYTWIRYAENVAFSNNVVTRVDGMTAIPNDKTVYIGFAYNKTTKDPDSNSKITDYTWSKFIGSDGVAGESGYTWIKYAKNVEYQTNEKVNVETMYDDPKDMSYIGLAFNQTKREESNDPNDYQWSLIKGARGGRTLAIVTEPKRFTSGTIKYRILTSTVLSESKSEDVIVGDVLQTSSYLYPVISIDSSYVNLAERKSARGARTFVITTTPAGATTWNGVDYPHFKSISAIQNESKIVDNVVIGDMLQLESILYPVLYVGEINAYLDNPITIKGDPGRTPVDIVPQFAFTKTIMDSAPTSDSEWYPDTSNYSSEKPIIWERVIYYYKYPNDYVIVGPYISSDLSELQTSVAELKIEQGKAQLYAESLNHYNLLKDSKFKTITIIGSTIINSLHLEVTGLYKSIITKYTGKMTISFTISCSKSISTSLYYHTPSGYGLIANNISTTISGQKYSIPIDITENDDKQNIDYFYFAHPQSLTENNTFTISDAMLNLGDNAQPWTSSTDDNVVRRSEIDVQDDGIKMFSKKLPIKTNGDIIVPSELNSENANGTTFIINDHLFKAEIITEGLSKEEGESGIVFSVKQNKDGVVDASGNQLNSNPTLRISDTTIEVNTLHAESIIANNLSTSNLNLLSVCDATDEELVKNKASSDISDLLNNKILNKELEINCFGAGLSLNGIYGSGSLIINLTAALIEPSITNCKIPIIIKPKTYYISKLQVSQSDQIYIEDWQLGKSTSIITAKNMSQIFCSLSNYTGTGLQCNSLKGSKIFINKSDGGTTTGTIKAACSELGTIAISKEIAYTGNLSGNENSGDVSGTLVENTVSVNMKGPYEAVGDKGKSLLSSGDPRVGKWNMSSNPGPSSLFSASIQIQSFPAGITSSNIVSAKLKVTRVAGVGSGTSDPFGIYVGSGSGWPITRGGLSYSSGAPSKDDAFAYFTLVNGNSKTIDVTSAIKYMLSYTSYKYLVIANYDTTKWGSGTSSYSRGYSKWKFTSLTITYKGT